MIKIEEHYGVKVLRDDLLPGGTKSVLMPSLIGEADEYVYASPVYGGFQIALAQYCQKVGKRATIVCAERKVLHPNTEVCLNSGANVIMVKPGYLSVAEKVARDYCEKTGAVKLEFGAKSQANKDILAARVKAVIAELGREPQEIFCAIGSGTLVESILQATETAQVTGVAVGMAYENPHERLTIRPYHKPFDKPSKCRIEFPSMPNYDLKAFEYCLLYRISDDVLFWNVL